MDPRFVASSKLLFEQGCTEGDAGRRDYTAAELDAIADFSWPWEGVQRALVACLHAMRAQRLHRAVAPAPGRSRIRLHAR